MTDEQSAAEQLDEDVLGTDPHGDDLPGLNRFVDIGPMSAEDPTQLMGGSDTPDSVIVRDWRQKPEVSADSPTIEKRPVTSLIDVGDPDELDDEEQLLGEAVRPQDGQVGPEAAALRIEPDQSGTASP